MIASKCPSCGSVFDVPGHYQAKAVKCPTCHADFTAQPHSATASVGKFVEHPESAPSKISWPIIALASMAAFGWAAWAAVSEQRAHDAREAEYARIDQEVKAAEKQMADTAADGKYVEEVMRAKEPEDERRKDEVWKAYREGNINLAEREAMLTQIKTEWENAKIKAKEMAIEYREFKEKREQFENENRELLEKYRSEQQK